MADDPVFAPIKVAAPTEVRQDWADITKSLDELARWIARTFAIDVTDILSKSDSLYVGSQQPEGEDIGKLWIKSTTPPGLGIPFSDSYVVLYPFPPNCPVLWTKGEDEQPSYVRKLSDNELSNYGLTDPEGDDYYYVILEP